MNSPKIKTFLTLFTPSSFGAVLYTFFAGLVIFLNQFNFIAQVLQLPHNFNLFAIITRALDTLLNNVFGAAATQTIVVGFFWALVGLGVYIFLQGIARFVVELGENLEMRKYYWPKGTNRYRPLLQAVEKVVFRGFALLALMYVLVSPLARLLTGPIWKDFIGPSVLLQLSVWFIALWIMLHVCVILLRLVVLRARLFG